MTRIRAIAMAISFLILFALAVDLSHTKTALSYATSGSSEGLFEPAVLSNPISIYSNEDFESMDFPGSGIEGDPYRIEGLQFEVNSSGPFMGIRIWDTDVHFVIQNCIFKGYLEYIEDDPFINGMGIELSNVKNGLIFQNNFSLFSWGIMMMGGSNVTIRANNFNGTSFLDVGLEEYPYDRFGIGIDINWNIYNCTDILVEQNTVTNCSTGIHISQATHSIIRNNTVLDCAAGIESHRFTSFNEISNNNCSINTSNGISLVTSWNTTVNNNTCNYNRNFGIWLDEESFNNTIIFNVATANGNETVWPTPAYFGMLTQEEPPAGYGIWANEESRDNLIVWNDMIGNNLNAKNDGPGNSYEFNYWSDYGGEDLDGDGFGDQYYIILGDNPTNDPSPRVLTLAELSALSATTTSSTTSTTATNTTASTTQSTEPPIDSVLLIAAGGIVVLLALIVVIKVKR